MDTAHRPPEQDFPERIWIATLDNRTRHDHAVADGQTVGVEEPFDVGGEKLMFPGDPSGSGWNIYNCRCTQIAKVKGVDMSDAKRRARDPVTGESEVIENMTYQEWYAMKEKQHGKDAMEVSWKKVQNESSDKKQFEEYKEVLGKNAPKSFAKFQDLKYNSGKWEALKGLYRYKGKVPEATKKDYEAYLKVKATGVIGSVRIPPEPIDASVLTFRDNHAARHGCSVEDAQGYVRSAVCSIRNKRWDGESINFFSKDGAAYVDEKTMEIKASYPREEFKSITRAVLEVFD